MYIKIMFCIFVSANRINALLNLQIMKKYLQIIVTSKEGRIYNNDLTLSENHLITTILRENKSVTITLVECTKEHYKRMFA